MAKPAEIEILFSSRAPHHAFKGLSDVIDGLARPHLLKAGLAEINGHRKQRGYVAMRSPADHAKKGKARGAAPSIPARGRATGPQLIEGIK